MIKKLSAFFATLALTLTSVFGVCVQTAPLLPGENELNGAQTGFVLPGTNEIPESEEIVEEQNNLDIAVVLQVNEEKQIPIVAEAFPAPALIESEAADAAPAEQQMPREKENKILKVAFNGEVSNKVIPTLIGEVTYVPLRTFCVEAIKDVSITWDVEKCMTVCESKDLKIQVPYGQTYIIANDRVLFRDEANIVINGTMYVPVRSIAAAFGAEVEWIGNEKCVDIKLNGKPITPASQFYNQNDLLWLARIINAESRCEPLNGKIAVGNVIMNRAANPEFPDSIYDVIFDNRYSIQFYPITSQVIYNTPSEESVIAAKACLEGYSISKEILYFMNPRLAVSSWISRSRSFVLAISNHSFYA